MNRPTQLTLGFPDSVGETPTPLGAVYPLTAESSLPVARHWFRQSLIAKRSPLNTIDSYCFDLTLLDTISGGKSINQIGPNDIAAFLGDTGNLATRKRRLTSLRRFFAFLLDEKMIAHSPADGFFPQCIPLKTPVPLTSQQQTLLLEAAANDEAWALTAVWLMMRLGLSRGELLALRIADIELTDPANPVVAIVDEQLDRPAKRRRLAAEASFASILHDFLEATSPVDRLFPVGFQAVNGMVERLRKEAGMTHPVTPQTLRHTFAVQQAKADLPPEAMLALLGLADDPRNRASIERYYDLVRPPLKPATPSE